VTDRERSKGQTAEQEQKKRLTRKERKERAFLSCFHEREEG
jgi:hypothetical protein